MLEAAEDEGGGGEKLTSIWPICLQHDVDMQVALNRMLTQELIIVLYGIFHRINIKIRTSGFDKRGEYCVHSI